MCDWLYREAKCRQVKVLHNHSLWMMPNVYPGWVAYRYGVPYIVSPRGTLSTWAMRSGSIAKRLFWPFAQRPSLSAVTCWHATSNHELEDIRRLEFRQPVALVPNGVDVPALPPKKSSASRTLLFLGRIHRKKGLDLLLPAWRAVHARFRDWKLVIAGPDNAGYLAQMRDLAANLQVERVEFVGALFGHQKWMAYRNADLFVLPTYSENFGIAVAEALAAGTPAIVTHGAPWEELETRGAGWWIKVGLDPLIATLEHSLGVAPQKLREMGDAGRRWMQLEYSWSKLSGEMLKVYDWLLAAGPKPASIRE
jgi:glycosyltransferase involved in cell wall biosynthesis